MAYTKVTVYLPPVRCKIKSYGRTGGEKEEKAENIGVIIVGNSIIRGERKHYQSAVGKGNPVFAGLCAKIHWALI